MTNISHTSIRMNEICIVMQGPVCGKESDPYNLQWTKQAIENIRNYMPGAQVILSTWEDADISGLSVDKTIFNKDPGPVVLENGNPLLASINRQIVSTNAGVMASNKKYILKTRTDSIVNGANFISFFGAYSKRRPDWRLFEERIIIPTFISQNPRKNVIPFNPSDFFQFGLADDLKRLWDIPLLTEPVLVDGRHHYQDIHWYTPEQYLWVTFLRKHGIVSLRGYNDNSQENIELTELTFANNLVMIEPDDIPIESLKHGRMTDNENITYHFSEWLDIYRHYVLSATSRKEMIRNGSAGIRVALCISGAPRFYNKALEQFLHQISGFSHCDIFFYIWHTNEVEDARLGEEIKSLASETINVVQVVFADEYHADVTHDYVCKNGTIVENIYKMYYAIRECHALAVAHQQSVGIIYDYFIRSRADITLSGLVNVSEFAGFADHVIIPSNSSDFDINDQMAIAAPDAMNVYANLFDHIEKYTQLPKPGALMNPEYLLKHHLTSSEIPIRYESFKTIINKKQEPL